MTYHVHTNNNYNPLVSNQFQPDSFRVVQEVYYSLEKLKVIQRHLNELNTLGSKMYQIEHLMPYLNDIQEISKHLNNITSIESNLFFLRDISPRIEEFIGRLNNVTTKLDTFDLQFHDVLGLMETNTKHLEDLFCQYETELHLLLEQTRCELQDTGSKFLEEIKCLRDSTESLRDDAKDYASLIKRESKFFHKQEALISHLNASDAVTLAQFSKKESDFKQAEKLIRKSEDYGNNESLNKQRLNYKYEKLNVMNILEENNELSRTKE